MFISYITKPKITEDDDQIIKLKW